MKKNLHFLRLVSLFALLAVSTQASANSTFWSWLYGVLNREHGGDRFYSELTVKSAIGEGTVYVEWGRTAYNNQAAVINDVNANRAESMTVQSPDDDTANAETSWGSSRDYAPHHYLVVPVQENGWEFENWYTDEDCTQKYNFGSGATQNFTHEGTTYIGYAYEITSTSRDPNKRDKEAIYARFQLIVTLNKYGYSTLFYSEHNLKVPSGVTATTYTFDSNNKQLLESTTYSENSENSKNRVIPAGEAVVLHGAPNTTYKFIPVTGTYTKDPYNILEGTDTETQLSGDGKFYALSAKSGVVGFYWMADGGVGFTCPAHKAYLHLSSSAGSVKGFAFDDDDATGINNVNTNLNANEEIYDLSGRRLNKMQKGINIVNGKKIMVK